MALKSVYVGSHGPIKYDDTNLVNDPEGKFPGETQEALKTDGTAQLDTILTVSVGFTEVASEATPGAGQQVLYAKTDGGFYRKDDTGAEVRLDVPATGVGESVTISGGIAAATGVSSYLKINTEGGAATDDLTKITGFTEGVMVVVRAADTTKTVILKNGADLLIGTDVSLDDEYDTALLFCIGSNKFIMLSKFNYAG
jgi:hypothetical protein